VGEPIPYEFPASDKRAAWEQEVRAAIKGGGFKWTHVVDEQWILSGKCPHCGDTTAQYFDTKVLVAHTLDAVSYESKDERIKTQVACTCSAKHSQIEGIRGCGYGAGLDIEIPVGEAQHAG
jgi:hypothetical protein